MRQGVIGCCVFLLSVCSVGAQHCDAQRSKVLKFSISSRRNATGHWIAQVHLDHGGRKKEAGPWDVDVEHTTAKCGDEESIFLTATVIAPPYDAVTSVTTLPMGYQLISGLQFRGYYKLHTDLKTWYEALASCEQEGAHLAIFNSEEEAMALSSLWDANPKIQDGGGNNWAHVGFHDLYRDKQYVTIFNQSLSAVGYMKFISGEPQERSGEDCGVSIRRENLLADIDCKAKMPYFCELQRRHNFRDHDFAIQQKVDPRPANDGGIGSEFPFPQHQTVVAQTIAAVSPQDIRPIPEISRARKSSAQLISRSNCSRIKEDSCEKIVHQDQKIFKEEIINDSSSDSDSDVQLPESDYSDTGDEDEECLFCTGRFSEDKYEEKWAKCYRWAQEACGIEEDNFVQEIDPQIIKIIYH